MMGIIHIRPPRCRPNLTPRDIEAKKKHDEWLRSIGIRWPELKMLRPCHEDPPPATRETNNNRKVLPTSDKVPHNLLPKPVYTKQAMRLPAVPEQYLMKK
jgi:hypothetical protein